jgi:hypothetical protein
MPPRRPLSHADVRRLALALPGAHEGSHHGRPDLRVGGKIFAGLPARDPHAVHLKSTAAVVDALVRADPATFRDAWGGTWLGVDLARADRATLRGLIGDAWALAAPKRCREASRPAG